MTTDAWGIDDGWFGTDGQWHQANPDTIEAIRAAMGEPVEHEVQVVRPGATDALRTPGRIRGEDGRDLGELYRVPSDLPLGIHELEPSAGGPPVTLLAAPESCHVHHP